MERILLSLAHMGGREQEYIKEAFDTNWVVPLGPNVDGFEKDLEAFLGGGSHVTALSSGTGAIHLSLVMLGVGQGDEVVCQSFTFSASANPITYQGAHPVFVDSERDTWNISPEYLERAIVDRKRVTGRYPKAIIAVHLYGMPARMDEIMAIAAKYSIPVIEDAAEALGSVYKGHKCGTIGRYGILSFNGNKIITTSGGGALVSRSEEEARRVVFFSTQSRENRPYYHHEHIGYNYRMSNICAGIGRGQMEVLSQHVAHRREIHDIYARELAPVTAVKVYSSPDGEMASNYWLTCITVPVPPPGGSADELRLYLESRNIESRLLWKPLHLQPVFAKAPFYGDGTSESLFDCGLCLPSGSSLTDRDILRVCAEIKKFYDTENEKG